MSIAELPAGDKMSLKGKIFDLQRKLNLLDVEQQNTENFPFQPQITDYKLPHRANDFVENMKRAEEQRKEKFEHLKEMVMLETGIDCTFSPQISNRGSKTAKSDQPAHHRLYEKGLEYRRAKEEKQKKMKSYDFDGVVLFQPKLSDKKPRSSVGTLSAEEYLFRDARDRAERREISMEEAAKESRRLASERKMSKRSEVFLQRKHDRIARNVFDFLLHGTDVDSVAVTSSMSSEDGGEAHGEILSADDVLNLKHVQAGIARIQKDHRRSHKPSSNKTGASCSGNSSNNTGEGAKQKNVITTAKAPYDLAERVWGLLDVDDRGAVGIKGYLAVIAPVLKARGGSVTNTLTSASVVRDSESSLAVSASSKQKDITLLFQFIMAVDTYLSARSIALDSEASATTQYTTPSRQPQESNKSCTALESPTQDDSSESLGASSVPTRDAKRERVAMYNRVLSEREKATQLRLEELRASIYEESMKECTFKPTITKNAERHGGVSFAAETLQKLQLRAEKDKHRRSDADLTAKADGYVSTDVSAADNATVFDRLYSQKDKVPKSIAEEKHRKPEEREMDGCTFVPQLHKPFTQAACGASRVEASTTPAATASAPPPPPRPRFDHTGSAGPRRVSVAQMINSVIASVDDEAAPSPTEMLRRSRANKRSDSVDTVIFDSTINEIPFATTGSSGHEYLEGDGDNTPPPPPPPEPKGYSTSIQRMRTAIERRNQKKKEDEEFFLLKEENYKLRKRQFEQGCKPFRLRTEERHAEKARVLGLSSSADNASALQGSLVQSAGSSMTRTSSPIAKGTASVDMPSGHAGGVLKGHVRRTKGEDLKPVRLYVEIKLGGGVKPSHIAVADNDDPCALARSFCKIYSLDQVAEKILTDVVLQNMQARGIPIGGTYASVDPIQTEGEVGGDYQPQDGFDESIDFRSEPLHENDL